jgi:signal transduction histidine kinase
MPDGGEIRVFVGAKNERIGRIDVIDSGPGIAPELCERVFDAYFSTKKAGTGLGLATTRQLVREHGGRIHVHSKPPHGTCFTILLPRC